MVRRSRAEEERGFTVLLEEVRHEVKLLAEHQLGFDQKVDNLDRKFTHLDQKVTRLDQKVMYLDQKVTHLDQKVDQVGGAVLELSTTMKAGFASLAKDVRGLSERFDAHERAHAV